LRRAWVGYQRQLDEAMADAGFADRAFPDGRVLRMCRDGEVTIAGIGRALGISRQGAAKVVAGLGDRGYVRVQPSATSARDKVVAITPRAEAYLEAQRKAARRIEQRVRRELGDDALDAVKRLCAVLAPDDDARLRDYLRQQGVREI